MKDYVKLFLFSAVTAAVLFSLQKLGLATYFHSGWPFMIIFYFLQSLIILFIQKMVLRGRNQNFVLFVIGSISFRLLSSLVVAVTYLVAIGEQTTRFIIMFFALYLLFLGFELFTVMTNLRSNFEKRPN